MQFFSSHTWVANHVLQGTAFLGKANLLFPKLVTGSFWAFNQSKANSTHES